MSAPYYTPIPPQWGVPVDFQANRPRGPQGGLTDIPKRWTDLQNFALPYQAPYLGDIYERAQGLVERGPYAPPTYAAPGAQQLDQLQRAYGYGAAPQPYQQAATGYLTEQFAGQPGQFAGAADPYLSMALGAAGGQGVQQAPYQWLGTGAASQLGAAQQGQYLRDPYRSLTQPSENLLGQLAGSRAAYENPYTRLGTVGQNVAIGTAQGQRLQGDPYLSAGYLDPAARQQYQTITGDRPTQNWATQGMMQGQQAIGGILGGPTQADPFFQAARPGIQQLSATASGQAANPYLDALYGAQSRAVEQSYQRAVQPQIETRYAQAGRFGSGAYEGAKGQAQAELGRTLSDLAGDVYGRGFEAERGRQVETAGQLAQMGLQGYGAERGIEADLARSNLGLFGDVYGAERAAQQQAAQLREERGFQERGRERTFQEEAARFGLGGAMDVYEAERQRAAQAAQFGYGTGAEAYARERQAQDAAAQFNLGTVLEQRGQERGFQEAAREGMLDRSLQAQLAEQGYGLQALGYAPSFAEMERANLSYGLDAAQQEQALRQARLDDQYRRYQMPWEQLGLYQQAIGLPFEYASRQYGWGPGTPTPSSGGGGGLGGLF